MKMRVETSSGVKDRNHGLDLFRVMLMFGIVLHHCCYHTVMFKTTAVAVLFLFTLPAVDGFVAISGWFGTRFSIRRLLGLGGTICFCSGLMTVAALIGHRAFGLPLYISPGIGWFTQCYVALCVVGGITLPMSCDDRSRTRCILLLLSFATFDWGMRLFGIASIPGFGSHSFVTFLFVYCMARDLSSVKLSERVRRWVGAMALLVLVAIVIMDSLVLLPPEVLKIKIFEFSGYNAPFVMLVAVLATPFFASLRLPVVAGRFVSFLAPSMFSVYLLHDAHAFGHEMMVVRPLAFLHDQWGQSTHADMLLTIIWSFVVFSSCVLIDLLARRMPIAWIRKCKPLKSRGCSAIAA